MLEDLIDKFEYDNRDYEITFELADAIEHKYLFDFYKICQNPKYQEYDYMILDFINSVDDVKNIPDYVSSLLRIYAVYLRDGIALIPYTHNKKDLELVKLWCKKLYIKYSKVKVNRYVQKYCLTHKEIVPEDDPCPHYWIKKNCYVEYDHSFEQTKIIIHDDEHDGTFEELDFEWDDRYVDGAYMAR